LLQIGHVVEGSNAQNPNKVIMNTLMATSGLVKVEVPKRLLCFGANGVSTFQGVQHGVIVHIQEYYAPLLIGMHCKSD
jgi:hypothetical protein